MAQQERDPRMQEDQGTRPESESQDMRMAGREGSTEQQNAMGTHGDSAVGRENPAAGPADADEALGNRVGGYGSEPEDGLPLPDAE